MQRKGEDYGIPRSGVIACDSAICHGCGICELVCSLTHDGVCGPSLSRISVLRNPLLGEFKQETCRQCNHPECYYSCPVTAIHADSKTGARTIDRDLCIGCGVCAKACPFNDRNHVVKHNPNTGKYVKCDLCAPLGTDPQCVTACPWGALKYVPTLKRGV